MNPDLVRVRRVGRSLAGVALIALVGAAANAPRSAGAQIVTPKTVPVFQGGQFDILPSATAGMGGISISVDDSLADAFVNPAKATRVRGGTFFAAPFRHGVSGDRGGGRSLPLGGAASIGNWSVAGIFALQQVDRAGPMRFSQILSDRTASNQYLSLSLARGLGRGVSLGVNGSFAALGAVDGVDLLYGGSDHISQSGSSSDIRVGLTKEFAPEKSLEVMVLHSRYQNTHDVHFRNSVWDPIARKSIVTERTDRNEDRTHIWGAHAEYTQPLNDNGWRIGWLGTITKLSHPKIPNYVLQSVPRDPGSTMGFNAGVGLSRVFGGSMIGFDLIHEPMSSETWADAASDTAIVGGGTIKAGGKTVENEFAFRNTAVRVGFGHDFVVSKDSGSKLGIQLGMGVYSINYQLNQTNNVQKTYREQRENWLEWTPTIGFSFRTRAMQVRYNYSSTCAGRSCMDFGDRVNIVSPNSGDTGGIINAPSSALTFDGGTAKIHKFWISVPIK